MGDDVVVAFFFNLMFSGIEISEEEKQWKELGLQALADNLSHTPSLPPP